MNKTLLDAETATTKRKLHAWRTKTGWRVCKDTKKLATEQWTQDRAEKKGLCVMQKFALPCVIDGNKHLPCPRQGLRAITPLTSLKDCTMDLGFSFGSRNRPDVAVFPISSADCSRACVWKKKKNLECNTSLWGDNGKPWSSVRQW